MVLPNTNCRVTSLQATGPTGCFAAGKPFPGQPVVEVRDDGGNRITCDTGVITASIAPGTGPARRGPARQRLSPSSCRDCGLHEPRGRSPGDRIPASLHPSRRGLDPEPRFLHDGHDDDGSGLRLPLRRRTDRVGGGCGSRGDLHLDRSPTDRSRRGRDAIGHLPGRPLRPDAPRGCHPGMDCNTR